MNTTLLTVAGYVRETYKETWEDVGGPESGPRIVGHGAGEAFVLDLPSGAQHVISVEHGEVVDADTYPPRFGED